MCKKRDNLEIWAKINLHSGLAGEMAAFKAIIIYFKNIKMYKNIFLSKKYYLCFLYLVLLHPWEWLNLSHTSTKAHSYNVCNYQILL